MVRRLRPRRPSDLAQRRSWPESSGKIPEASAITAGGVASRREDAVGVAREATRAVAADRVAVAEVQEAAEVVAGGVAASRAAR